MGTLIVLARVLKVVVFADPYKLENRSSGGVIDMGTMMVLAQALKVVVFADP